MPGEITRTKSLATDQGRLSDRHAIGLWIVIRFCSYPQPFCLHTLPSLVAISLCAHTFLPWLLCSADRHELCA